MYKNISRCRICGNEQLKEVLNLGEQYLSSSFVKNNDDVDEVSKTRVPLTLLLCDICGLVQLRETVDRDLMYRSYFYRSGVNPMMRDALADVTRDIKAHANLKEGDSVLDIGCNDGTMLTYFPITMRRIGMDPAQNINRSSLDPSITVIQDYFSADKARAANGGEFFKVVSSIAMFYDLDDPNAFVSEVKSVLAQGGTWCVQLSYLATTIQTMNFYDICHEHLLYYSLRTLKFLMERHDLKIIDASQNDVNGGSLRFFAVHADDPRDVSPGMREIEQAEQVLRLSEKATYEQFAASIEQLKRTTLDFLEAEKKAGGTVVGLGASTKGNVLLQYFGITKEMLPAISDRYAEKVGLRTLGTDIRVVSEEEARDMKPSAMLVLIWFFKDELLKREKQYLEDGGKLFFPMPYPHVVTKEGEKRLS
ncbi:methyltransferase domain-containing protein [Candidatus Kaiserbacteria bacterium]|nr:methyltransferase domain-containing protein [Candidatus Kaiserbacteria bacterium]